MNTPTLPTIHINGTGKQTLLDGYLAAYHAVDAAAESLRRVEFNARDYYVQGPNAWPEAVKERNSQSCKQSVAAEDLTNNQTMGALRNRITLPLPHTRLLALYEYRRVLECKGAKIVFWRCPSGCNGDIVWADASLNPIACLLCGVEKP